MDSYSGRPSDGIRRNFLAAVDGFLELVQGVRPDQWCLPGLGIWNVRALVGHSSRALSTIETYIDRHDGTSLLAGPVEYYLRALHHSDEPREFEQLNEAIAERGRQAGDELGDDPVQQVRALAERVLDIVSASPDDRLLATAVGRMRLIDYLPTRTFELTVHSLDLASAMSVPSPGRLAPAIQECCELAGQLAARRENATELLLLMTGRGDSLSGISVL
ncbi:MAG: maleylpyruvate isomerase N-terminal domain-containing protein [Ferrimicrobium sp.]